MVIALFGESCTGKSSVADALKSALSATVYTGKDYLRFDKSEALARQRFSVHLSEAAASQETVVYVASEKEQLSFLPDNCLRVRMTAALPVICERFSGRTGGQLPPPLRAMLERKHGMFDQEPCDLCFDSGTQNTEQIANAILCACETR